MDQDKKVSVIICYHHGDLIYRCLNSIPKEYEVIVVSSKQIWFPNVKCVHGRENNPALLRNIASVHASGDYLVFLDDDVMLHPHAIRKMLTLYTDTNVAMVYGTLYKMDDLSKLDSAGYWLSWTGFLIENDAMPIKDMPVLAGKSAFCSVRRTVFEVVGKFDKDFVIYGEETDLSWRVWLSGRTVIQSAFATGLHASETIYKDKSYYNQEFIHYHGCKNYITMLIKNLGWYNMMPVVVNVACWAFMALLFLFKRPKASKWIVLGIFYNIKHLPYILSKRKKIRRRVTDKGLSSAIYRRIGVRYYIVRCLEYLKHELHT